MIKGIKLNNCTPYQQAEIADCKKINFFFGANGSGKSTIGTFLSGAADSRFNKSLIIWSDDVNHEKIEVYNNFFTYFKEYIDVDTLFKQFIDDNIRNISFSISSYQ